MWIVGPIQFWRGYVIYLNFLFFLKGDSVIKQFKIPRKPRENPRKTRGKPGENPVQTPGNPQENPGKTQGKPWEWGSTDERPGSDHVT